VRGIAPDSLQLCKDAPVPGAATAESAGAGLGRPDKWLAAASCAADYNNACKL